MEKPVRVLHVVSSLGSGGVAMSLLNSYRHMNRGMIHYDFISHRSEGMIERELRDLGSKVYHLSFRRKHPIKSAIESYKIFKNENYDIIQFHGNLEVCPALFMAILAKKGIRICHTHTFMQSASFFQRITNLLAKILIRAMATNYFACSKSAGKWGFGQSIENNKKYNVVYNEIDVNKFSFNNKVRENKRKELGLEDKIVIGTIGRFVHVKNHEFLIEVFSQIYKANQNTMMIMIGNGDLEEQVREKVVSLGLEHSVVMLGAQSNVNELLQAIDVFVLPSKNEGFGMVLIEAQTSGVKCFASNKVPEEVKVTDLLTFLPIDEGPTVWSETVLENINYDRIDQSNTVREAGFDINIGSKVLQELYMKIYNK